MCLAKKEAVVEIVSLRLYCIYIQPVFFCDGAIFGQTNQEICVLRFMEAKYWLSVSNPTKESGKIQFDRLGLQYSNEIKNNNSTALCFTSQIALKLLCQVLVLSVWEGGHQETGRNAEKMEKNCEGEES